MKKNLLTLITFALVLVNLVLTGVTALMIVPETSQVNALITKISEAINLDIKSGGDMGTSTFDISSVAPYTLSENMTINLKRGEDGVDHFAVLSITLMQNINSDAYATYGGDNIANYEQTIRVTINNVISSHTIEELRNDTEAVQDEIKSELNKLFGSDFIAAVGFSSATYQ